MSMIKTYMIALEFEKLVGRIYEANGYSLIGTERTNKDMGIDLLLKSQKGETVVVETKVSRTRIIPRGEIIKMLEKLAAVRDRMAADRAVLVIAGSIGIPIHDVGTTEVVDLLRLRELTVQHPRLASELESIMRELMPMVVGDADALTYRVFGDAHMGPPPLAPPELPSPRGQELQLALRAIPAGKKGARKFEEKGFEALRYIFENDFSNWSTQKVSDGGISRYDGIARISSEHDFWKSIVVYFRSWYVVFEFKNYAQRISQGQIYTTEKYLFMGAMRTVAFIISRKGADKNALAATRGAVRESGKLIVHLSVEDLCKMMDMKDNNDEPNAFLFDRLDEMLMKLER